jgi:hypothetical protein
LIQVNAGSVPQPTRPKTILF